MLEFIKLHKQKILYLVVGGWNTLFGYAVFAGLYHWLDNIVHYTLILGLSYIISITNAYVGYKIFVFRTKGNILKEYFRFYLVYGISFVFNLVTLPFFVEILELNMYISQALITVITILSSYVLHQKFSFKGKE